MRIDELAARAGVPVRNVRHYRDRGLLPEPRRVGRTNWYGPHHLARLRLVRHLLDQGYNSTHITSLTRAWEAGLGVDAVFGLEAAVATSDGEVPILSRTQLAEMVDAEEGELPELLAVALDLGIVEPLTRGRFRVVNPPALEAGVAMIRAGIPPAVVGELARSLQSHATSFAQQIVAILTPVLWEPLLVERRADDIPQLIRTLEALRPAIQAPFANEVTRALEAAILAVYASSEPPRPQV